MKNPELFQGEKYIRKNKQYFEGWYFKNTNDEKGISFIPGISIDGNNKKSFIQIITNKYSYYINYDINDFSFCNDPFYIKIGNNYFSSDMIHIDIKDDIQKLVIYGDVEYSNSVNINTNFLNPNIMGPFSYIPFMECNHAILSMKSKINGLITINEEKINFNNDIGYIEKDWGCSFPVTYIWCQGNDFENINVAFMLSVANIPFGLFHFEGIICSLIIDDKEYRFATYNNAKLIKYDVFDGCLDIILKKGNYLLYIETKLPPGLKLVAPIKGKMKKNIYESICASTTLTLKKKNKIIFSGTSANCGLEIVNE